MGHFPVRKLLNYSVGLMIHYITDQLQALFDAMEKKNKKQLLSVRKMSTVARNTTHKLVP